MIDKKVRIFEMPSNSTFDDYPEDTFFVLDEDDENDWSDVENIKD